MIRMNKSEFMAELAAQLSQIEEHERADAITFYSEYFDEAGVENEQTVIKELGSPAKVAAQIKADAAVKEVQTDTSPVRKWLSAIALVFLGICALPVALPLSIAAVAVAFAVLVTAAALVFALVVFVGAILMAGILMIISGFGVLLSDPAVGIFYIGWGLAILGISTILVVLTYIIACVMVSGILKLINYIRVKIQKKHAEKMKDSTDTDPNENIELNKNIEPNENIEPDERAESDKGVESNE